MTKSDPYAGQLSLPPELLPAYAQPYVPPATRRKREQFVQFPMWWVERLKGASGDACRLTIYILHRYWKNKYKPFKLANMALAAAGIDRFRKSHALVDLERRGLIKVERRRGKSPIVEPILSPSTLVG